MVFAFHLEAEFTCLYLEGGESSSFGSFFFFVLFAEVGAEGSDLIVGSAAVRKFEGVGGRHKHEPKPLLGCSHLELINRNCVVFHD